MDAVPPFDLTVTDKLLSTTRSVRKRLDLDRPVDLSVVLDCLRVAIQAPTGSNTQSWRFVVVTDQAKKTELARLYRATAEGYLAAGRARAKDEQNVRVVSSSTYLMDVLDQIPVLLIPCLLGRPRNLAEAAGFFGSILPAVWSFQLALRARGLGSVYTTLHLGHEQEAGHLLGIPDTVTQAGLLPVAWTKGTEFKPAVRRPVEELTYLNDWKHPID